MQDLKPGVVTMTPGDYPGYTARFLIHKTSGYLGKKNCVATLGRSARGYLRKKNHASLLLGRKTAWFFELGAKLSIFVTAGISPPIIAWVDSVMTFNRNTIQYHRHVVWKKALLKGLVL
jgi:hypothetical protein